MYLGILQAPQIEGIGNMMNQEWHQCGVCHKIFVRPEIEYKTDPYRSGMLDEDAPVGSAKLFCEKTEHSKEKQQAKHEHNIGVFSVEKAIMGRLKAEVKSKKNNIEHPPTGN